MIAHILTFGKIGVKQAFFCGVAEALLFSQLNEAVGVKGISDNGFIKVIGKASFAGSSCQLVVYG